MSTKTFQPFHPFISLRMAKSEAARKKRQRDLGKLRSKESISTYIAKRRKIAADEDVEITEKAIAHITFGRSYPKASGVCRHLKK